MLLLGHHDISYDVVVYHAGSQPETNMFNFGLSLGLAKRWIGKGGFWVWLWLRLRAYLGLAAFWDSSV